MSRLPALGVAFSLLIAGCGGNGDDQQGSALVDPEVDPPINSLEVDPDGSGLLLTTNRGFFRIDDGEAAEVSSEVTTPDGRVPVGTFLALTADGERLIGSGHPDRSGRVADFLGSLVSRDGGESWRVTSRYAIADLHVIHDAHGQLYAFDAVTDALLVSDDGGRVWEERGGPPERVVDFVVDPGDPDHLLAATAREIFRSTDGGERWSATTGARSSRLAWPAPDVLRRVDADGRAYAGTNEGAGWEPLGSIDGEVWRLVAETSQRLYATLSDATILVSENAGESWQEYFTP